MIETADSDTAAKVNLTAFNVIAAAFLATASVVAHVYLIPVHVPLREGIDQGLTARFMPRLAAWATLILAVLLLLELGLRHLRGAGPLAEDNEDNDVQQFGKREIGNVAILSAGSAVYVALLYAFGFHIATAVTLLTCFWAGGLRSPVWLAVLAISFPYALQQALWYGLYVIVPQGSFF